MKSSCPARRNVWILAMCLVGLPLSGHAATWGKTRALQGPFGVSSPPESPLVVANANGHVMTAWNATGAVRFAEKTLGLKWTKSQPVPGGSTGAGPVAVALGNNEVAAIAYVTAATKYVPAKLKVTLRPPGGGFAHEVEPAPGAVAWDVKLGVACDGSVTLVWNDYATVWTSRLAGTGRTAGACDGVPGTGGWSPAVKLSSGSSGASLVDLATNDDGMALVTWQQGSSGHPTDIVAALRSADGAWQPPETVSAGTGQSTWNPKPGLDAAGNAAVGYIDGYRMFVVRRPAADHWAIPTLISGTQTVYYPSLSMSTDGSLLAAWMVYDVNNVGSIWASKATGQGAWEAMQRLSSPSEDANWPSSALAPDGQFGLVAWVDNASNITRAATWTLGAWRKRSLAPGWWGGVVPVAAGGGMGVAGWAQPAPGNPNSATLYARTWE